MASQVKEKAMKALLGGPIRDIHIVRWKGLVGQIEGLVRAGVAVLVVREALSWRGGGGEDKSHL